MPVETSQSTSTLEPLQQINNATTQVKSQLDQLTTIPTSEVRSSAISGISLLDMKNHMLTSYLHNLVNLLIIRISQTCGLNSIKSSQDEDGDDDKEMKDFSNQIVEQLVWLRLVFEKIKPMESRLKYQIDKLLKTVEELNQGSFSNPEAEIDHIVNDPLSFRPNPAALETPDHGEYHHRDANDDGRELKHDKSNAIYRPPRVAPVAYPGASNGKSRRIAPAPIALREHISLSTNAPLPESTTGLSNTAAKGSNRAKALERMKQYEESNMTRLFSSKKDARRRRNDEAAIALGVQTSSSNKNMKRKLGALEGEFDGVLTDINRKSDRYSDHIGSAKPSNKKSIGQASSNSDGFGKPSHGGKFKKKGAFDKAIKKLSK